MSSSPASPSAGHRLVTVVIPTYGRPRQIRDCLTALTAQTLGRGSFEVVVVDDGSPQPLGSLADDFAGRLDLRVVRQDNAGPSAARNRGVEEATTEMVAFTDDDCLPDPDWLAVLTAAEGGRPGSLVGGSTRNGLPENLFSEASQWIVDMVYDHFNHDPDAAYFFTSNNMLCSKRRYLEVGGFDTGFTHAGAEDRDFCDRWRARGWPLILRPDARIEHRHRQDFSGFFGMYFRYGRGACLYRARRLARATGTMREELGFHTSLPAKVWNGLNRYPGGWRRAQLCGALAVWQVANAAGFAAESLALRRRPGRGR